VGAGRIHRASSRLNNREQFLLQVAKLDLMNGDRADELLGVRLCDLIVFRDIVELMALLL